MKQLLLILFFFPLLIYSQANLSFYDIKQINSKQMFLKVVLENGFQKSSDDWRLSYGYNLTKKDEGNTATTWASFYTSKEFRFDFYKANLESVRIYERIVQKIQTSCEFKKVRQEDSYDAIYYSCPGSKYIGWIGYYEDGDYKSIETSKSIVTD
tara:strand:+ start:204 stop:665 length:462 start_codon:yes stop_codon:yes gene_type:complete